jgi:hypothetical protein
MSSSLAGVEHKLALKSGMFKEFIGFVTSCSVGATPQSKLASG